MGSGENAGGEVRVAPQLLINRRGAEDAEVTQRFFSIEQKYKLNSVPPPFARLAVTKTPPLEIRHDISKSFPIGVVALFSTLAH